MKKSLLSLMAIILMIAFLTRPTFASPGTYTVSFTSNEIDLLYGVKIRVRYSCVANISHPNTREIVSVHEGHDWYVGLQNGALRLDVYLPSPINRWYNISQNLPLGSYYDIPITTGTAARVSLTASASLSVSGDARLSKNSVTIDSADAESFELITGGSLYSNIVVTIALAFQVNLGLAVGIYPLSFQIASANIGSFNATPTITEGTTLLNTGLLGNFLVLLIIIIVALVFAYWLFRQSSHKERSKRPMDSPSLRRTEPQSRVQLLECPRCGKKLSEVFKFCPHCGYKFPVTCPACGKEISEESIFCPFCGKKLRT